MYYRKTVSSPMTRLLVLGLAAVLLCVSAYAQDNPPPPAGAPPADGPRGGGPGRMTPEQNAAALQAQATMVAESLGLSADLTAKLVAAYKASRESQMAAMAAMRKEGERPDRAQMQEVFKAEGAKFETAIKAFLTPEQTAKAIAPLGSFGMRWQNMALVLQEMKLDPKVKAEANKLVLAYVVDFEKTMQAATGQEGMEAARTSLRALKEKLDADMAKILTAEQAKTWSENTAMRGGGMRGGMGGGGQRGGAGAPGGPGGPGAPGAEK